MFGLGVEELVVILVILLLLFGGKKLPELSRSIGASIKDIRKGFTDEPHDKKHDSVSDKTEEHKS